MKRVLFAGEINVDLVLHGYEAFPAPGREVLVQDSRLVLGSATAIMAMGLARLGTPVAFVGKVGDDLFGRYCLEDMASRGIDVSRVVRDGGLKTGVTVSISHPGDRALVTHLGAITALTGADVSDAALAGLDHLHVSSFFFQEGLRPDLPALFARARRAGLTTSLDTGFDPSGRWDAGLRATLRETDLFFPNEVELRRSAAATTRFRPAGPGERRDPHGGQARRAGSDDARRRRRREGARVSRPTVDTTGAGDSFNAGFLHRWLRGAALEACGSEPPAARSARGRSAATDVATADAIRRPKPWSGRAALRGRYRWWIGGLLFVSTVINYLDRQTLSVLAPNLKTEFHWYEPGLRAHRHLVSGGLRRDADRFGPLVDRLGTRSGLTLAVAFYSVAAMLTSLANGLRSFCGFRFLLGAGEAANWPAATKAVSEWFPRRERGWAVALFDSGSSIGAAIAPVLVLLLVGHFGAGARPSSSSARSASSGSWLWRLSYHPPESHPRISPRSAR